MDSKNREIISETLSEFQRWFGQSKIVDIHEKSMKMYHGTLADIRIFRPGDGRNGSVLGNGVMYFYRRSSYLAEIFGRETPEQAITSDRKFPKEYLAGANIVPVYLKIENPLM